MDRLDAISAVPGSELTKGSIPVGSLPVTGQSGEKRPHQPILSRVPSSTTSGAFFRVDKDGAGGCIPTDERVLASRHSVGPAA
jgi:hypothetical protein